MCYGFLACTIDQQKYQSAETFNNDYCDEMMNLQLLFSFIKRYEAAIEKKNMASF